MTASFLLLADPLRELARRLDAELRRPGRGERLLRGRQRAALELQLARRRLGDRQLDRQRAGRRAVDGDGEAALGELLERRPGRADLQPARGRPAAGAVDVLAVGRDRVDRVGDHLVGADPARDAVGLAVAHVDRVVAQRAARQVAVQLVAAAGAIAVDDVLARPAGDGVVAVAGGQRVVAGAARQHVAVRVAGEDHVVAAAPVVVAGGARLRRGHLVGGIVADERAGRAEIELLDAGDVVALALAAVVRDAVQREREFRPVGLGAVRVVDVHGVDAGATVDHVRGPLARAGVAVGVEAVVAVAARQRVGAEVAVELVVAGTAVELVVALLALERVDARAAAHGLAELRALERVVAVAERRAELAVEACAGGETERAERVVPGAEVDRDRAGGERALDLAEALVEHATRAGLQARGVRHLDRRAVDARGDDHVVGFAAARDADRRAVGGDRRGERRGDGQEQGAACQRAREEMSWGDHAADRRSGRPAQLPTNVSPWSPEGPTRPSAFPYCRS